VTEISESSNGIILPAELAGELRVVPGEVVILRLSTVTGQSSVGELELVATVEEAQGLGISRGYVHLERMNELIGLDPGNFQSLNLYLEQPARMNQVARELTAIIGNDLQVVSRDSEQGAGFAGLGFGGDEEEPWDGVRYAVSTLDDILGQVLAVLQTLDLVALAVFAVLLLITMVGITNTYRMVVLERRQEIGTMRAVGMQRGQVLRLFIAEAALTAVYGLVIGGALAALLMVLIGLIPIASPALQFFLIEGKLAFSLPIGTAVRNVLIVLVLAIFAAFFPARGASRMRPVDALRATA
jgi:putative ABC transport system permease protein